MENLEYWESQIKYYQSKVNTYSFTDIGLD